VFLLDLTSRNAKQKKIAQLEAEIDRLRRSVLPAGITDDHLEVRDCAVLVVHLHDFPAFITDYGPDAAADRLTHFATIIDGAVAERAIAGWRVAQLHQLGNAIWVVFNLAPADSRGVAGQQMTETARQAIQFTREVAAALAAARMEFRIGIAGDATARAGIISQNRLLFDLYGQAMAVAAALARQAAPGTALVAQTVARFDKSEDLTVVHVQEDEGKDELVYELILKRTE
jgi:class 3 adenylate cyclase